MKHSVAIGKLWASHVARVRELIRKGKRATANMCAQDAALRSSRQLRSEERVLRLVARLRSRFVSMNHSSGIDIVKKRAAGHERIYCVDYVCQPTYEDRTSPVLH